MDKYFGVVPQGYSSFKLFGTAHLSALSLFLVAVILVYVFRGWLRREKVNPRARYILAIAIILNELALNVWRISIGEWKVATSLPLHMCGIAMICSAVMLWKKKYQLFELAYFWGITGAFLAMLTPDLNVSFPHFRFVQFMLGHALIILAILFMVFVENFKPTLHSIGKTFLVTNLYMFFVAGFNYLTGGNYMFLCEKPAVGTLFDLFGPWPWYIGWLEVVAVVAFFISYAPFALGQWRERQDTGKRLTL